MLLMLVLFRVQHGLKLISTIGVVSIGSIKSRTNYHLFLKDGNVACPFGVIDMYYIYTFVVFYGNEITADVVICASSLEEAEFDLNVVAPTCDCWSLINTELRAPLIRQQISSEPLPF